MEQLGRPGLSDSKKAEAWQQWKHGQSLGHIGPFLGKHAGSIYGVIASNGRIPPLARCRSRLALTFAERDEISRGIAGGLSIRHMAAQMRRPLSTVSCEIARHGGRSRYRAARAD